MPLLMTRAAGSARGFGQLAAGAKPFTYIGMLGTTGTVYGTNDLAGSWTTLQASAYSSVNSSFAPFVVADGSFFGSTNYVSTNAGSSWVTYHTATGTQYAYGFPSGLNGGGAYRPSSKTVASLTGYISGKGGPFFGFGYSSNGGAGAFKLVNSASTGAAYGLVYAPAIDAFVAQTTTIAWSFSGSNPNTFLGSAATGNTNGFRLSVSSDGYPMCAYDATGVGNYQLRKFLTADLSSFTNLGSVTDGGYINSYKVQTPSIWYAPNNLYYRVFTSFNSSTVFFASSSDALTWNVVSVGSVPAAYTYTVNFTPVSSTEFWISGVYLTSGKSASYGPFSFKSTNAGVSWSSAAGRTTFTKNLA